MGRERKVVRMALLQRVRSVVGSFSVAWIPPTAVAGVLAAAGCAGSPAAEASRPAPAGAPPRATATSPRTAPAPDRTAAYTDGVQVAALRERALSLLTETATGGAPEVRVNSIEALSGSPRRVEPIVRAALVDPSPAVRITAAVVVGNAKLESSASFVEPLTQDPLLPVRASAVYAMKRCGRNVDLTPLGQLLADPSPRWRAHAASLLGKLGDKTALPMLEEAVRDTFPRVSASEVRLMELQVAQARVRLGDEEAIHSIRAALFPARSEDLEATALAAQLTGELNDRAATRELVMLTRMTDDAGNLMPPEVRMAAAGSLGSLRVDQATPDAVAIEYITDAAPVRRAQAAFVLGQCGRRENLGALELLLEDSSPQVRVTAAAAIVRLSESGGSAGMMR